jgi:hypothetical protein
MTNASALLAAATAKRNATAPAKPAPAAPAKTDLVWENIDPSALPDDVRELFYAISKARSAFESAMAALIEPPAHLKLAYAYKRGLAIALAPISRQSNGLAALIAAANAAD